MIGSGLALRRVGVGVCREGGVPFGPLRLRYKISLNLSLSTRNPEDRGGREIRDISENRDRSDISANRDITDG